MPKRTVVFAFSRRYQYSKTLLNSVQWFWPRRRTILQLYGSTQWISDKRKYLLIFFFLKRRSLVRGRAYTDRLPVLDFQFDVQKRVRTVHYSRCSVRERLSSCRNKPVVTSACFRLQARVLRVGCFTTGAHVEGDRPRSLALLSVLLSRRSRRKHRARITVVIISGRRTVFLTFFF